MSDATLTAIQSLQFQDREAAERALLEFVREELDTPFAARSLELRPSAVSLNSMNGVLWTEEDEKLFFKTHVEPGSVVGEYYNAQLLADAGYPVISPSYASTEYGKQFLVYPFFEMRSLFDIARDIEVGSADNLDEIAEAQERGDCKLYDIYRDSRESVEAPAHADAPIHQLFHHRLTRGRFDKFYRDTAVLLPDGEFAYAELARKTWRVNGNALDVTLADCVETAAKVLDPAKASCEAVIGHGDAHNGNVFYDPAGGDLIYFDPAFAGRHSPFADLVKPLIHNVFLSWLYFPTVYDAEVALECRVGADSVEIEHDFALHEIRQRFLTSKVTYLLRPLVADMRARGALPVDWKSYVKSAAFCCPFLTLNLTDRDRFPPKITALGLSLAVEFASPAGVGALDRALSEAEQ